MTVQNASRDQNNVPTLLGVSSADGSSTVKVWADPDTHRLLVDLGAGVVGPGLSTDKAIVRWDGTTGETIQNSTVIVADNGVVTTSGKLITTTGSVRVGTDNGGEKIVFDGTPIGNELMPVIYGNAIDDSGTGISTIYLNNQYGAATTGVQIITTSGVNTRVNIQEDGGTAELYIGKPASGNGNLYMSGKSDGIAMFSSEQLVSTGVTPVANGTYTVGAKITPVTGHNGTITVSNGIITAIQQAD